MAQRGAGHGDLEHRAFFPGDRDIVADAKRARKDDGEAGDHVAEHALHGERDTRAGDAESRDQRQQLDAEILQRHDGEQREHQQAHGALDQRAHRRVELKARQHLHDGAACPAAGEDAGDQDQDRDEQLWPEFHSQVDSGIPDLLKRLQLVSHGVSFQWWNAALHSSGRRIRRPRRSPP